MADKKIYRSRKDKMLGGVCGGVAEYFDIDATIVRLVAVLLFFAEGIGLLLYIVSWVVIPEKPSSAKYNYDESTNTIDVDGYSSYYDDSAQEEEKNENNFGKENGSQSEKKTEDNKEAANSRDEILDDKRQRTIGLILVGLGSLFLIDNIFPYFRWHRFWPLILVGFGIVLLLKGVNNNE